MLKRLDKTLLDQNVAIGFSFFFLFFCMLIKHNYLVSTVIGSPDQSAEGCEQQNLAVCLSVR